MCEKQYDTVISFMFWNLNVRVPSLCTAHAVNIIQSEVVFKMLRRLAQLPQPEHEAVGSVSLCHPLSLSFFTLDCSQWQGARPLLQLRPPRVEMCPRHVCKRPRVRVPSDNKNSSTPTEALLFLVRVEGFEPPASCSQSRRATNCATPGYSVSYPAGRIHPNRWERRDAAETGTGNS